MAQLDFATLPLADAESESPARLDRFARAISDLFNPAVVVVPLVFLFAAASGFTASAPYAILYLGVAVLLPVCDVLWLVYTGQVADIHLPQRRERTRPFAVSVLCSGLGSGLLMYLGAPPLLVTLTGAVLLQMTLLFLVTLFWQISVHSAAVSMIVTTAILMFGVVFTPLAVLLPLVSWSRVRLERHTIRQVIAGGVLGCATILWVSYGHLVG